MGSLFLPDEEATAALGRRIAAVLRPGDLVLLDGDLGAGKTALSRAIIRALMSDDELDVPSPTFALVQPYQKDGTSVLHADLYRLASERETDELGLFDRADAIVLIEWPERAPGLVSRADGQAQLSIPASGLGRLAEVTFLDNRPF